MGVAFEQKDGGLRLTHYGWVRLILPLLGLIGFAVWWFWTSWTNRQEYLAFKATLPGLAQDLKQRMAEVDAFALSVGKQLDAIKAADNGAEFSPASQISDVREAWAAGHFASAKQSVETLAQNIGEDQKAWFDPLRNAVRELDKHRLGVLAAVQEIQTRAIRVGAQHRPEKIGLKMAELDRCVQGVEFAFEKQENPWRSSDGTDTSSWIFAKSKLEGFLKSLDAISTDPEY